MAEPAPGRVVFATSLLALATAMSFDLDEAVIGVYWHALKDIADDIREATLMEAGNRKWFKFPRPSDLKMIADEIITTRRSEAYRASLPALCPTCNHEKSYTGPRWKEVSVNGVTRMTTCDCRTVAMRAMDRVGSVIQLPPSREEQMELGQ